MDVGPDLSGAVLIAVCATVVPACISSQRAATGCAKAGRTVTARWSLRADFGQALAGPQAINPC